MRCLLALCVVITTPLVGCGGDGGTAPPVAVGTVGVTPSEATIVVGSTTTLTAVTKDAAGNTLSGRVVTWSSSNPLIATVSTAGVASGVTAGSATITAASEGKSGSATISVTFPAFNPSGNTSLSGTQNFSSINIPAGITVTVTSDLVLNVTGAITIAGALTADCRAITLTAEGGLTISGTVRNDCTALPAGSPPALKLYGKGGIELSGATVNSSGDLDLSNDPTLQNSDFPSSPTQQPSGGSVSAVVTPGFCPVANTAFVAKPATAADGSDGQNGGAGANGATWVLQCRGELRLTGGVLVQGQGGGNGGNGDHASATAASARGGKGGNAGTLKVRATGALIVSGANNTLQSGDGGDGGNAAASGLTYPAPPKAASATATGGDGGDPGLVEARAVGVIDIRGSLTLEVGDGGSGGQGSASAADGVDAGAQPAQIGGDATGTGGKGGKSPDTMLQGQNVLGLDNITVTGGAGGNGGGADGLAGKGGKGNRQFKPGADGGNWTINGGMGGDAQLKNQFGLLVSSGGDGGSASFYKGNGGLGWSDCTELPFESGGRGGNGGNASGNSGLGGSGSIPGIGGKITASDAANGGDGGDGEPFGLHGVEGTNNIGTNGQRTFIEPAFNIGQDGLGCPGKLEVKKVLIPVSDPGKFNLQIDGTTLAANATDAGTTGERQVPAGVHSVGETAGSATNLADYGTAISCKGNNGAGNVVANGPGTGPLNVTVNQGDDIVCLITNVRNIDPGFDLWETVPFPETFQLSDNTPIPAGFFGPGSDQFQGTIRLGGVPIDRSGFGTMNMKVHRLGTVQFPDLGQPAVPVPIEIVALNLVSVQPITVTYNGGMNPELWDVTVGLSTQQPQPQGSMTITRTHANGGTFDSQFPVQPRFTFTRVVDNFNIVLQDDVGPSRRILWNSFTGDYQFVCPSVLKKVPGVTNPNFDAGCNATGRVPIRHQAFVFITPAVSVLQAQHTVLPAIP